MFERNGNRGEEIYTHPHFLKFLRYFLFGADLPQRAIDEFEEQIGNPEWFSGSDILALGSKTRELVRKYRLTHYNQPEEFYKLTLDCGLDYYAAGIIRKHAMTAKR